MKNWYRLSMANVVDMVEVIKHYLINSGGYDSYEEFINGQSMGDCQSIVADICKTFPVVKKVFGEIEIDNSYIDDYGDEQNMVTHHWVEINGEPYDFSKGTLKGYVSFESLFEPEISPNELDRYQY